MAKQQQVRLEDFVQKYNDKVDRYGDQLRAAGINPQSGAEFASTIAVKTVPSDRNSNQQTVVSGNGGGGGAGVRATAQELWEEAARRTEEAKQATLRRAEEAKAAIARRQEEAKAQQLIRQAQGQPVLERPYFQRGGSRITLLMGAFFGDVMAASIWFFGALNSLQVLRAFGLKGVDSWPWDWLVWVFLLAVTCFENGYMPNFRHFITSFKQEKPLVIAWLVIAGVDMGSNFFDLLGVINGKSLPLFAFQIEFTGWTLIITSFILAGLVALGPEPLFRYFTRTIRDLMGW